ncbi:diacylglycerol kinase [Flavobacterium akiainvivens]|uniref:Diacylglycerol kinase n=1 Tax=Flavobacterium akiainvivens TaxID=1202724 RepID=A0A0M9VJI3_9FLAO|nr:YegS/Rv2252/BmrU family lipid kinase [Flavobacterium akiainvivens]KOS07800.1 diacylglycerol kinase [Flavobacterium akiainvivens]SFQ26605.1 lipid kinase, YegS/Rv2252/BmrU family [Flavobacterium akiainvivens]
MASEKFLFVINPISGGNDKAELVDAVREYAANEGVELIEYETTGKDDEGNIRKLYEEHKTPRLLVAGGDGTIKMAAEAVEHHDVVIGVLPAGSANGLSVDLDLPTDLQEILKVAFHGNYMEMDMVCINNKKSLHLADIGANAELIKRYEEGTMRGKLSYALKAISTLATLGDPFHVTVEADGNTTQTPARMVVIANTQKYGTGVTINPVGKPDDGFFEIVVLKSLDVLLIGKIMAGNMPLDADEDVVIISTQQAVITVDKPTSFQVDGEFCGEETKLDVRILHKQMRVAIP